MKQEERRKQTIDLLLRTVKELIREKGCDLLTIKDIMARSGLSKGAIFHYINTKEEIYAWVLQERLEEINKRFFQQVEYSDQGGEGPLREITKGLPMLEDPQEITNQVMMYLLGKSGQPAVDEVLKKFYEQSVQLSEEWIKAGQRHGVIPESVHADTTAELFVLISLGIRMRSAIPGHKSSFKAGDFSAFMSSSLGFNSKKEGL